jgi:hypothetical protein
VTFTGAKLRGDVSDLIVIDNGYNGCNAFTPETFAVATLRESVVPVYKLQTTEPLAFDAAPEEIKDALESLSLVTDVAVSRKGEYNGFSWMVVTFNSMKDENYAMLLVNGLELSAAISAKVQVISVQEYLLTGLQTGVEHFVNVASVNSEGVGAFAASTPASKQPTAQVPTTPVDVRAEVVWNRILNVQYSPPRNDGGVTVSHYVVPYDHSPLFNSGSGRAPLGSLTVWADAAVLRADVQSVTVVSDVGFQPSGLFVLAFEGQNPWSWSTTSRPRAWRRPYQ